MASPAPGHLALRGKYSWDTWLLDPVSGRAHRRASFRRNAPRPSGLAVSRRFTLFAVYAWNGGGPDREFPEEARTGGPDQEARVRPGPGVPREARTGSSREG